MEVLLSWAGFTLFAALRPRFPRPEELSPSVIGLAVREQRQGRLEPQADDQAAHVAHFTAAVYTSENCLTKASHSCCVWR